MQFADAKLSRSSLLLSLKLYSAAVRNMEQTVLIPSLLREVPADDVLLAATHDEAAEEDARDLYECYLMLKAIRNTVDSGLVHPSDDVTSAKGKGQGRTEGLWKETEELELVADPEVLFQFHLRGLFSVMGHLTKTSQSLTAKYMDIIGILN
ncbi:mid1-interacting protein 1-B-like [Engraulis encrasicolus]|uniref:mid1-interacting protein 1-B-like n=1 Tax=Engraulis encrasicolus TaxID=184585 RepID=UPI002FD2EABD